MALISLRGSSIRNGVVSIDFLTVPLLSTREWCVYYSLAVHCQLTKRFFGETFGSLETSVFRPYIQLVRHLHGIFSLMSIGLCCVCLVYRPSQVSCTVEQWYLMIKSEL